MRGVLDPIMVNREQQARAEWTPNKGVTRHMLKTGLLILSGNAATSLLLLARNLLVARLIPVADYGVAATFAIAMALVEMASTLGLQQQIVQAKDAEPRFQAALQGFQVLRGVIAGIALFALAGPLATFMGVGQVAWAYQVLAVVPVLNALQHFDIHRLNRDMVFGPAVLTGLLPALVSFIIIWPLAAYFGDYRVMLWTIVVQAALMAGLSHVTAQRPYRLVFDTGIMGDSLRFGWPLLVNGILLFVVFQGDKIIVGRVMGMEALALFALAFTLTLTPTLVMAKSAQNFFLPQLSRATGDAFDNLARVTVETSLMMGSVLVVAVVLAGPPLVAVVLGVKYTALGPLLVWLAIAQAVRVIKAGPAIVALSKGETTNAMLANIPRILLLPVIWWAAVQGAGLVTLIWIGIAGEVAGYALALWLLVRRCSFDLRPVIAGHLGLTLVLVIAALGGAWIWVTLPLAFLLALWTLHHLRGHIRR